MITPPPPEEAFDEYLMAEVLLVPPWQLSAAEGKGHHWKKLDAQDGRKLGLALQIQSLTLASTELSSWMDLNRIRFS
jgi:hypothetical protein